MIRAFFVPSFMRKLARVPVIVKSGNVIDKDRR